MKNTRCVAFCAKPFMGFIKSKIDQNVYIKKAHQKKYLGFCVDDSILVTNNQKH